MYRSLFALILFVLTTGPALCQEIHDKAALKVPHRATHHSPDHHPEVDEENHDHESHFPKLEAITFNGGFHTEFYNNVQTDSSGTLRKLNWAPTLGTGLVYPLSESWKFLPEINWVLPYVTESAHIIKNIFMIRADIGYDLLDWFRLRFGTSLMWQNQQGRGGEAKVNNGNGTSTFYYPSENRSSLNNTLDLGAEIHSGDWALRLQTYTYSAFAEDKRQLSYTLFATYYWKQ
jgi:hypothetical protein